MEYSDVALPLQKFSPELLAELTSSIAGSIQIEDRLTGHFTFIY